MRQGAPAFRAGDRLRLKTAQELNVIWSKATSQSLLSLHQILDPDKEKFAGNIVQVVEVQNYHGNIPVYRLNGHQYVWPEEAMIDPVLDESCEIGDPCCGAHLVYHARATARRIEIVDCENFVYCALAKVHPQREAQSINEIARIRHLRAFELQYGFDGKDFVR